jgi:hypothetical protein
MLYNGKQVYAGYLKRHHQVLFPYAEICCGNKYLSDEISQNCRSLGFINDCLTRIKNLIPT